MKPQILSVLLVVAFVAAACATEPTEPSASSSPPSPQASKDVRVSTPVRMDTAQPPFNTTPPPPVTGTPLEMPAPGITPKVFHTPLPFPQPDDTHLQEGTAYLTSASVEPAAGGKVLLSVAGNLPTPCHQLRVAVERRETRLQVRVYSVVDPQQECAQALAAFSTQVKLGPFPDGEYEVVVNGRMVGKVRVKH